MQSSGIPGRPWEESRRAARRIPLSNRAMEFSWRSWDGLKTVLYCGRRGKQEACPAAENFKRGTPSCSDVGQRASDLGAPQSPREYKKREWNQNRRENKQRCDRRPQLRPARMREKRRAHALQSVGDWNQPRENLQRPRQNRNRIHHSAHQPRYSQEKPLRRISSFEEQRVAGRNNSQTDKR